MTLPPARELRRGNLEETMLDFPFDPDSLFLDPELLLRLVGEADALARGEEPVQ